MPDLSGIDLTSSTACTAAHLSPLASSHSLRSVKLVWCSRLDIAALKALAGAPLRELDLYGTNLKPDELKEVAKAWPGCVLKLPDGQRYVVPK